MFLKKAAGAVVFYKNPNGKIEYLLLKHSARYWNFPKGGVEAGEREIDTNIALNADPEYVEKNVPSDNAICNKCGRTYKKEPR